MTGPWERRLAPLGLSPDAAERAASRFADVEHRFAERFGDTAGASAWWVPGRIEVLGKHTDYGGGRSLLAAVERGFHLIARPRDDGMVRLLDVSTNAMITVPLSGDVPPRPGHWTDYPITVVRRIARDFPGARRGMDAVVRSSLPPASGLSSSSALVISVFLPLARFNRLDHSPEWERTLRDPDALAGYLGALENGRIFGEFHADRGVGTHGGSEDHTAITRCRRGELAQYHFLPVTHERSLPMPDGWSFVIGVSGVHAAKAGRVQAHYNGLSGELTTLLGLWRERTRRDDPSVFAALRSGPDAPDRLARIAADASTSLAARLAQFRDEVEVIIPGVVAKLEAGDVEGIGPLVDRSQRLAETTLANQVHETIHLASRARQLGAAAASAFGAGFGGSVWALVRTADAADFMAAWRDDYVRAFPMHRARADCFVSQPGPAASEVQLTAS